MIGANSVPVGPLLAEHALMRILSGLLDPVDAMRVTGIPLHDPGRRSQVEDLMRKESLVTR